MIYAILELQISYRVLVVSKGKRNIILFLHCQRALHVLTEVVQIV